MREIANQLTTAWNGLNRREQMLASIIAGLTAIMIVWSIISGAINRLDQLSSNVDRLQEQIVNSHRQILMRQQVDEVYAKVASQHSSEWDKYEVYERLRQEIFRLAQKVPPSLNEDGVPVRATNDSGELVKIPELRQGSMDETDEGYREYKISFRIPQADITDLFAFLERLQASPQSLRIDGLQFSRSWNGTDVSATIDLTRIIVDGAGNVGTSSDQPRSYQLTSVELTPDAWTVDGGVITQKGSGLHMEAQDDRAEMYLEMPIPALQTYEVVMQVAAKGSGLFGVAAYDNTIFAGAERLPDDGAAREVRFQFTTDGEPGDTVRVKLPFLTLNDYGATLEVMGVAYRALEG